MPVIEVEERMLIGRIQKIQKLLRPLSKDSSVGPALKHVSGGRSYILAAHDGSPPTSNYRDWRFRTFVSDFRAMYFEEWVSSRNRHWYLEKAYLNIYKIDLPTRYEREYLCLHCDPNEPDNSSCAVYKKGPHLHISIAADLSHAHIALNKGHLEEVLNSVDSLTKALDSGICLIVDEVLKRI